MTLAINAQIIAIVLNAITLLSVIAVGFAIRKKQTEDIVEDPPTEDTQLAQESFAAILTRIINLISVQNFADREHGLSDIVIRKVPNQIDIDQFSCDVAQFGIKDVSHWDNKELAMFASARLTRDFRKIIKSLFDDHDAVKITNKFVSSEGTVIFFNIELTSRWKHNVTKAHEAIKAAEQIDMDKRVTYSG